MPALWLLHLLGRRQWRGLVALTLLVGLAGGAALAAYAGARRSGTAVDRFVAETHALDAFVSPTDPGPLQAVLAGPTVRDHRELRFVLGAVEGAELAIFAPVVDAPSEIETGRLLHGRRADPREPEEIELFESTAAALGVGPGDVLELGTVTPEQARAFYEDDVFPEGLDGPQVQLLVAGVARNASDLAARPGDQNWTFLSPAFLTRYGDQVGLGPTNYAVDLVGGTAAAPMLSAELEAAYAAGEVPSVQVRETEAIEDSIAVITRALWIFGALLALAGGIWTATMVNRQLRRSADDVAVLRALGLTDRRARLLLAGAIAPGLLGGAVLAVAVAIAGSALLPVGLARRAEVDPGMHVDVGALSAGAILLVVALAAIVAVIVWRTVRSAGRDRRAPAPSSVLDRVARRLPPAPGVGARFAFSAPRNVSGRARPALAGAVVAVVGLYAVAVVAAGIDGLRAEPARWGATWDVSVEPGTVDVEALEADGEVAAAAIGTFDDRVAVAGHETLVMVIDSFKGRVLPTLVDGHEPRADDEVALGRDTLRAAGLVLGEVVDVRSATAEGAFRVVGVVAFPSIGPGSAAPLADGVALAAEGGERLAVGDPERLGSGVQRLLIRWAPGVDGDRALRRLGGEEAVGERPVAPPAVARLEQVQGFPAAIAATLAVLGAIAVGYSLGATVRRRRADLGVLGALGFTSTQRRVTVAVQALSLALAALVIGVPVGLVAGRTVWSRIASSIGVAPGADWPAAQLALGAVAVVAAFLVLAAAPAWGAGRLHPADSLRVE